MADVFLSYAREDRQHAEALARALEHAGWGVWWDRELLPGVSYERVIEDELSAARCVVVLWSASARESNWVRDEASLAMRRNVLVPVLLDDSEPPLGFRQQQTADLAHWDGSTTDPAFRMLTQGIAGVIARDRGVQRPGDVRREQAPPPEARLREDAAAPPRPRATFGSAKPATAGRTLATVILVAVMALAGAAWWSGFGARDAVTSTAADRSQLLAPETSASVEKRAASSAQAVVVPSRSTLTLPRERVTLTILSGTLETLNADTRLLTLRIRFSNNGSSFYRTYYSNLRLLVDGVPRAPNDPPLEQVDAASAREFEYRFDLPAAATRAVLRVVHGDQADEIPLNVAIEP
jgi:hypothetical protein